MRVMNAARFLENRGISTSRDRKFQSYDEARAFQDASLNAIKNFQKPPQRPQEQISCAELLTLAAENGFSEASLPGRGPGQVSQPGGGVGNPRSGSRAGGNAAGNPRDGRRNDGQIGKAPSRGRGGDSGEQDSAGSMGFGDPPNSPSPTGVVPNDGGEPASTTLGDSERGHPSTPRGYDPDQPSIFENDPESIFDDPGSSDGYGEPYSVPPIRTGGFGGGMGPSPGSTIEDLIRPAQDVSGVPGPQGSQTAADGDRWTVHPGESRGVSPTLSLPDGAEGLIFSAGIQTDSNSHTHFGQQLSERTGLPTTVIYNQRQSFIEDVIDASTDRGVVRPIKPDGWPSDPASRPTWYQPPANKSAEALANEIAGRLDRGEVVPIVVHSEGAINLGNALAILSQKHIGPSSRDLSNLRLVTLGGALPSDHAQLQWAKNQGAVVSSITSGGDPIPGALGDGGWVDIVGGGLRNHGLSHYMPHITEDLFLQSHNIRVAPAPRPAYQRTWDVGGPGR